MNKTKFNNLLNWSSFSEYRDQLFGAAILLILIFHSTFFHNYGSLHQAVLQLNVGVEIFLFLSGMGLYFSYKKKPTYLNFEKKRFATVFWNYLIISLPFCIWQNIVEGRNFLYFLFDLSSISYWFKTENSPGWYVSLILVLYLLYPLFHNVIFGNSKSNKRATIVATLMILLFIGSAILLREMLPNAWVCFERAFSRIPIFILGCYAGMLICEKKQFDIKSYIFFFVCAIAIYPMSKLEFRFRYFLTCIPIMLAIILVLFLLENTFKLKFIKPILSFFGGITLELYLIHDYVMEVLLYYKKDKLIYYIITIAIAIPISYLLSLLRNKVFVKKTVIK